MTSSLALREFKHNSLIVRAYAFAEQAHSDIEHVRKYTGEPYITHPLAVAGLVSVVSSDPIMIAAALLHDTVEDTPTKFNDIYIEFGERVLSLVEGLTNIATPLDGNRNTRKLLDLEHIASASSEVKTIKLADLIHNSASIAKYDPYFALIYLKEKKQLVNEALHEGDPYLWRTATRIIRQAEYTLPF